MNLELLTEDRRLPIDAGAFRRRGPLFQFARLAQATQLRRAAFDTKTKTAMTSPGNRHPEQAVPPAFAREDLLAARFRVSKVLPYQHSAPPFISNLSLAIFSGLLMVFAFPEWSLWSLAWVGAAPLIMAVVREQRFWRSLLLGYVTGTIFYVGSSHWVTYSMNNYGGLPLWLCHIILFIFASTLGIFTGLFAGVMGRAVGRFGGWAILAAPVVWAASEWARLKVTGMGWDALGYSQAFQPAIIQIARLGGVYIVSALLIAANTALVFAMIYLERRRGVIALTAAGVLAMAAVIYGQSLRIEATETGSVSVAVVQPNIPVEGPWDDPRFIEQLTTRHILLSEQAIQESARQTSANGNRSQTVARNSISDSATPDISSERESKPHKNIDLVIWPESPMNFEYDRDPALRQKLADFTRRNDIFLLMNSWGFVSDTELSNSAMVIAPSGEKITQYDKIALVPFGEYVPARGWFPFMDRIPALVGDITPGASFTLSDVAGAKLGINICFEATRPEIARRMRADGASTLVQMSNELWFGPSSIARQMLAHAAFRAVENNVELIRATNSGLSARIDRYGNVYDTTAMLETATRHWEIKTADEARADEMTFYTRHGDVFAISCVALSLLLAGAGFAPEKWKEKHQDDD